MSELHAASIGRVTEPVLVVEGGITEREKRRFPFRITPPHFFSSSFLLLSFLFQVVYFSQFLLHHLFFSTRNSPGKEKKNPKEKQLCVREKTVRSKYFGRRFFFFFSFFFPPLLLLLLLLSFVRSFSDFSLPFTREREREKRPASPLVRLVSGRQSSVSLRMCACKRRRACRLLARLCVVYSVQ